MKMLRRGYVSFYQSADTYDSCIVDDADLDDIDENALNFYRKLRKEVNPDAEELTLNDVDLLRALGAIKKNKQGGYDLTYTGLLVFGNKCRFVVWFLLSELIISEYLVTSG